MAKFNVVQKKRRALVSEEKRAKHGDRFTGKLHNKPQPISVSGKRKRKLLKKWRRDQKEAIEKGLVSMQDVEMAAADGEGSTENANKNKTPAKFHMKKKGLKLKQLKHCGKKKRNPKPAAEVSVDTMVE